MFKKAVILLAFFIVFLIIYGGVIKAELQFLSDKWWGHKYSLDANPQWPEPGVIPIFPVNKEFSLVIPKIDASAAVYSNIDYDNPVEYLPILKNGLAHVKGSAVPEQVGKIFIFAHNEDSFYQLPGYNTKFFLLDKLDVNDEISLFYQGQRFKYSVFYKVILKPNEVKPHIDKIFSNNMLILQTTYPPGFNSERLLVVAKKD